MIGSRLIKLLRRMIAVTLAAIIIVSAFEGHSARAYFASPAEHAQVAAAENAEGHDHDEKSSAKAAHALLEDHSHSVGLIAAGHGRPVLGGRLNRWLVHADPGDDSSPDSLLRPPRLLALR